MKGKLAWLAAAMLVLPTAPLGAQSADEVDRAANGVADPVAAVRALYEDDCAVPDRIPLTPRLEALFRAEDERRELHDEPLGRIDFDWVVNGQDALISDVAVEGSEVSLALPDEPARMVVIARFANFKQPQELVYYWEKGADGWRLDDVVHRGEYAWSLSLLLAYGG